MKTKVIRCRIISTTFFNKKSSWCIIPEFFFNEYWNDNELYEEVKKYVIRKTNYILNLDEKIYLDIK